MNEIDMFVKKINKYYGNEDQNWRNFYFHGFQEIKYLKKNGKIRVKYRVKKNRPEEILIATCDQNSCSKKLN